MTDALETLLQSLLYEGYALYPYTPMATKNSTPTPFGIAYPPAYAETLTSTYDHLEMRIALQAPADAVVSGEVRLLAPIGVGHRAEPHRLTLAGIMVGALVHTPVGKTESLDGPDGPPLQVRLTMSARVTGAHRYEIVLRIENLTVVSSGLDRARALARSLLSTHPVARVTGGAFISALEAPCGSVNTFPVLAGAQDDAVVGATIILPDHPQIAPESQGGLFDSTEIEEALLLHLRVLSDEERASIADSDPAVREMLARADAVGSQDILALHGRVTISDPAPSPAPRARLTTEPPPEPPNLVDPRAGEQTAQIGDKRLRQGGKVIVHPAPGADLQARMLDGRTATLERIFTDYDGRLHLGVTIDDDPGQDLMRESGRYLYFFPQEVEVIQT